VESNGNRRNNLGEPDVSHANPHPITQQKLCNAYLGRTQTLTGTTCCFNGTSAPADQLENGSVPRRGVSAVIPTLVVTRTGFGTKETQGVTGTRIRQTLGRGGGAGNIRTDTTATGSLGETDWILDATNCMGWQECRHDLAAFAVVKLFRPAIVPFGGTKGGITWWR
jgi:hypothetical protein